MPIIFSYTVNVFAAPSTTEAEHLPCVAGLAELGEINEAFRPFAYTLFREDRIGLDTDQQTRAANETIRQSIERLLTMLSPYFMRDAATKVLEFLIRQYR